MRFGVPMFVGHLQVGDVVRLIHGSLECSKVGSITITNPDGTKTKVPSTAGWCNPVVGGIGDFRQGYDTMTVVEVTNEHVTFQRPYVHVYNGVIQSGVEVVMSVSRTHGGLWYELLSCSGSVRERETQAGLLYGS